MRVGWNIFTIRLVEMAQSVTVLVDCYYLLSLIIHVRFPVWTLYVQRHAYLKSTVRAGFRVLLC
jgi:hypothetical protein